MGSRRSKRPTTTGHTRPAHESSRVGALGAVSPTQVVLLAPLAHAILQTISFSLYLYAAELYPTRLRAVGTGFGSAWLRAGSSIGPLLVGWTSPTTASGTCSRRSP
jgi:hypothetical protein